MRFPSLPAKSLSRFGRVETPATWPEQRLPPLGVGPSRGGRARQAHSGTAKGLANPFDGERSPQGIPQGTSFLLQGRMPGTACTLSGGPHRLCQGPCVTSASPQVPNQPVRTQNPALRLRELASFPTTSFRNRAQASSDCASRMPGAQTLHQHQGYDSPYYGGLDRNQQSPGSACGVCT